VNAPSIYGKHAPKEGAIPAVALVNPKFPHNVGAAVRAASCFGIPQVWFTGNRVSLSPTKKYRLPREERMKGYKDVELRNFDTFFEQYDRDVTPVAVELRPNAEQLPQFQHPDRAVYVFGPEDGSIPNTYLRHCHRFVVVPTKHCMNLAATIYVVLYDRMVKLVGECVTISDMLNERRHWTEDDNLHEVIGLT
jgi:tRNA(Leu) C34 or U34 (ribose-2'-O)-methylase TrmL